MREYLGPSLVELETFLSYGGFAGAFPQDVLVAVVSVPLFTPVGLRAVCLPVQSGDCHDCEQVNLASNISKARVRHEAFNGPIYPGHSFCRAFRPWLDECLNAGKVLCEE